MGRLASTGGCLGFVMAEQREHQRRDVQAVVANSRQKVALLSVLDRRGLAPSPITALPRRRWLRDPVVLPPVKASGARHWTSQRSRTRTTFARFIARNAMRGLTSFDAQRTPSNVTVRKYGPSNASTVTTLKNLVSISRTIGAGKERQQDVQY